MTTVQYRLGRPGKQADVVEGPDDAEVVVTVPLADVLADDFDADRAYMQGRLKATGHTGVLFDLLKSGTARAALVDLAVSAQA